MMKLLSKKNKKGFTLVEVIVVLVILAILAAILIPSMTKWIDEANDKTAIVECRTMVLAAQTKASEAYGLNPSNCGNGKDWAFGDTDCPSIASVTTLADLGASASLTSCNVTSGKVSELVMVSTGGKTVTYTAAATGEKYVIG